MNYFDTEDNFYAVDKDILYYVHSTEQDQWDNFVLNDEF